MRHRLLSDVGFRLRLRFALVDLDVEAASEPVLLKYVSRGHPVAIGTNW